MSRRPAAPRHARSGGLLFALVANVTWAAQPLYWPLVAASGPVELLAHRVFWSAVICCGAVLSARRRRHRLVALLQEPRRLGHLAAAGACLATAWCVYIYAVTSGHVIEGSLGLFIVPLSTVVCAVAIFGERLRRMQWVAVAGAVAATVVLAVAYGRLPWIALTLCGLMAVYASLKKLADAPAVEGFTVECLAMTPLAMGYIVVSLSAGADTVVRSSPGHVALVAASGLVTAVPLLAHAESLRRLPLTTVGVLQYINPTGQFLLGVLVFHEAMSPARWTGFALAWASVITFAAASGRRRASGQARPAVQWRGRGRRPNSDSTSP